MWALGVITFILLSGKLPFNGSSQKDTMRLIDKATFEWPKNVELSKSCKSFIKGLLCKNTKKRMSANDALKHEWIVDYENKANDINILDKIKTFLREFNYSNKLHKILVNACLEEIDEDDQKVVLQAFHKIDMENKGNIDEHDICRYLVLNSKINKKYNENNDAQKHAKHIFKVIENGTNIGPKIVESRSIPIEEFLRNISSSSNNNNSNHKTVTISNIDDGKYIDDMDSDDSELKLIPSDDEINYGKTLTMKLDNNDSVSVDAFKNIMNKSSKKYPVDNIVKDLDQMVRDLYHFKVFPNFLK